MVLTLQLLAALLLTTIARAAQYEQYILAPTSRILHPASVYQVNGSVMNAGSLTGDSTGNAIFQGPSAVTYDFGKVRGSSETPNSLHDG